MKKVIVLAVLALAVGAVDAPASAHGRLHHRYGWHHAGRHHYALRVRYGAPRLRTMPVVGGRLEIWGRLANGDVVLTGRSGLHRSILEGRMVPDEDFPARLSTRRAGRYDLPEIKSSSSTNFPKN